MSAKEDFLGKQDLAAASDTMKAGIRLSRVRTFAQRVSASTIVEMELDFLQDVDANRLSSAARRLKVGAVFYMALESVAMLDLLPAISLSRIGDRIVVNGDILELRRRRDVSQNFAGLSPGTKPTSIVVSPRT